MHTRTHASTHVHMQAHTYAHTVPCPGKLLFYRQLDAQVQHKGSSLHKYPLRSEEVYQPHLSVQRSLCSNSSHRRQAVRKKDN